MKRFLLLISPYFITCFILTTLLVVRPTKIKELAKDKSDTTKVNLNYRPEEDPNYRPPIDTSDFEPVTPSDDSESQQTVTQNQTIIIVVGSFKSVQTANQLSDKLKPAGFKSKVEQKDGLFRVIAGEYDTEFDAQDDLNTLKEIGFEPWVTKN